MKKNIITLLTIITLNNFVFAKNIDIDFTKLNYNISSGIIYDMMVNVDKYIGKTIKIKGQFCYDETPIGNFYYVLLLDKTACCPIGLIFEDKKRSFPDDFPTLWEDIEITGLFSKKIINGESIFYINCQ